MNLLFVKKNTITFSILIFICIFVILNIIKPGIMYKADGSIRDFGINNNQKTILPIWAITIIVAIMSYLLVQMYLIRPRVYQYLY